MTDTLLALRHFGVDLHTPAGPRRLLDDLSLEVRTGERLGIVGASGAGKTTLANALLGMLPLRATTATGSSLRVGATDVAFGEESAWQSLRGRRIGVVPQEPLLALHPTRRIGWQLTEAFVAHGLGTADDASVRAHALLARVGFDDPALALRSYTHELSGGMRQRALIAAALLLEPSVLIADEPTTALDVTTQAQVLDLLERECAAAGRALVIISHDLDLVGERCERLVVLDAGRIVETGAVEQILSAPTSSAAQRLVAARRRAARRANPLSPLVAPALLAARDVTVRHPDRRGWARRGSAPRAAVSDVTVTIGRGEAVGIVGESGCGKSSFARAVLRLGTITGGRVVYDGVDLTSLDAAALRRMRPRLQLIPQDAGASLTPHLSCGDQIAEGPLVHGLTTAADAAARARALIDELGLPPRVLAARPGELSTGERQRVAIARALALEPELLVCDEPVASVDAPTRAALLDLLAALRASRGLAVLLISHDLDAVRRLCDRLYVMYAGRVVEHGPADAVSATPLMPYTSALLAAEPTGTRREERQASDWESPLAEREPGTAGCAFAPRCQHPKKDRECASAAPPLREIDAQRSAACWKV